MTRVGASACEADWLRWSNTETLRTFRLFQEMFPSSCHTTALEIRAERLNQRTTFLTSCRIVFRCRAVAHGMPHRIIPARAANAATADNSRGNTPGHLRTSEHSGEAGPGAVVAGVPRPLACRWAEQPPRQVADSVALGPRCPRRSGSTVSLRRHPHFLRESIRETGTRACSGNGDRALPALRRYRHRDVVIASAFVAGGRAGPRISSGKVLAGRSSKAVSPVGQGLRMGAVGAR